MDINKGLLFLDGVAYSSTAKILDLGFCGDFDYKNHEWNRLFVAFPATASANLTIKVFTAEDEYSASKTYAVGDTCMKDGVMYRCTTAISTPESWTSGHWSTTLTDSAIASIAIPAANLAAGGAYCVNMPTGLKRYVTVACSTTGTAPSKVTIGITNTVDSDCVALAGGIDWTYYKAKTLGTAVKGTPMQNVAEVVGSGADTAAEVSTAISAHAALTTGVHGLT